MIKKFMVLWEEVIEIRTESLRQITKIKLLVKTQSSDSVLLRELSRLEDMLK